MENTIKWEKSEVSIALGDAGNACFRIDKSFSVEGKLEATLMVRINQEIPYAHISVMKKRSMFYKSVDEAKEACEWYWENGGREIAERLEK